jgi:hypothetical protein
MADCIGRRSKKGYHARHVITPLVKSYCARSKQATPEVPKRLAVVYSDI